MKNALSVLRRRPILRVQLTLLYSGLALGLLAAVLLATNLLYGHSEQRAPAGTPAAPASGSHAFDAGPAAIGLGAAALAIAGAWWLAGRFLRPLRVITTTAREISATNLDRRLDLTGPVDELTDLSRTLNDLFGRLQATFEAQRHFVANASHELRTPLAGQRTLLQVALADPAADTASLRAACEEALQLGDQQERLIGALLTLATSERGVERWDPIDLADITRVVLSGHQREADRRGIHIDASLAPAPTVGDPRLATSLIANLLDNALRHNIAEGHVTVTTTSSPQHATIAISNTGPTIPHQDLDRLFRPLHHTGTQRVHHDGHGLGLAIVLAIAQAHGAELAPHPRPEGGLTVEVTFHPTQKPYQG
ncbi:sensor histidine kinase [Streptomyces odontomachi]|uniref:sensor histidine kinase n=1 Tax=Streptomyces odontomachi TaxID=2944940 RepID=UPI00210F2201|nr:HAMP domain-containing sensor histidine kinase [Streptomyces sp. ODS25]